jgi:hypothetical protein
MGYGGWDAECEYEKRRDFLHILSNKRDEGAPNALDEGS